MKKAVCIFGYILSFLAFVVSAVFYFYFQLEWNTIWVLVPIILGTILTLLIILYQKSLKNI